MNTRIDSASRLIPASPENVYRAFANPDALAKWIPPAGMTGAILSFDFREGGHYSMRLTHADPPPGGGKTSKDSDELEVRIVKLLEGRSIEQEVTFASKDAAFSGIMRMTWALRPTEEGTLVTVRVEGVPPGIRPEDHEVGLNSSLANLAIYLEDEK